MDTSTAGNWDAVRQSFSEQFEQDGTSFVYRRSQKGEAIRVSAAERDHLIDEFDRNVSRAKWVLYVGVALALGSVFLLALRSGSDLVMPATFLALGVAMVPYFAFYRWAWTAPLRRLAGRTPVAGERSPEQVQRLRFHRIKYGQLASLAFGGLMMPLIGSSHQNVLSGWNRLWLVLGAAMVLLAAVQAFRKWRFEQDDSNAYAAGPPLARDATASDESSWLIKGPLWRFLLTGAFFLALALILFTPAGKRLAHAPSFIPILMLGFGGWAVVTVVRGFTKGRIQPFARGFYNTYERETQPKRFWASMAWNTAFSFFFLCVAFETLPPRDLPIQDRCYGHMDEYSAQDQLKACNELIDNDQKSPAGRTYFMLGRGIAHERLKDHSHAILDFSAAIQLNPENATAYYERGLVYQELGELNRAITDFNEAIRLEPRAAETILHRGSAYQGVRDLDRALSDFNEVVRLRPDRPEGYEYRGWAYRDLGDETRAEADLAKAARLKAKLNAPVS